MQSRMKMLMGATALLYFGPLLAGLGGFGWAVVPVFALIFVLWLLILRPQEWPRTLADWQKPEALVALAARAAVQLLLVAVCFGIGRGIGGVLGALPPFPVMLPISISFLSIPLARLIWDPWKAEEMDAVLDEALRQVSATPQDAETRAAAAEAAQGLTQPLADLPPDTDDATLSAHLIALSAHLAPDRIFGALIARAEEGTASASALRALILLATDPAFSETMQGQAAPVLAVQAAEHDPELLELFARRCAALLEQDVDAWGDCPNGAALEAIAQNTTPEAAAALRDLIAVNDRFAPLDSHG